MDWYLDATDPRGVAELRHDFGDYLRRHASPGSDVDGAELVFSELLSNAVRHAPGPAWVHVDWSGRHPVVHVQDLGRGFSLGEITAPDAESPAGRGMWIVSHIASKLEVAAKRSGGARVSATLDAVRRPQASYNHPTILGDALPALEEADAGGAFGRESFLRALVVQLARAVERNEGPEAIEAAVAQVGADVGGQMERAYRAARSLEGALSVEQMADLYVRLKAAIDGDFYVIEADEEKIVLGNRACPFGDIVRRAPGLCRMTSSVFGGIAARNAGGASVLLEERIAVGDPECRVVVRLGGQDAGRFQAAHDYASPQASR